jgi:hypothetical protein
MDSLIAYFHSLNLDLPSMLSTGGILLIGMLAVSLVGRFVFGHKSVLNSAVSSAIGILFIYAVTVVCSSIGGQWSQFVAPLPFVTISNEALVLFSFRNADYTSISSELVSMVILALGVNLADGWLPKGKKLFGWLFFRCLTVVIGLALQLVVVWAFTTYLPEGIVTYAPAILLGILVLMMLTGALKLLVGLLLTTVNPLIAALYTFFFANVIGKQISKAVLTTALLSGLVFLLENLGYTVLGIAAAALVAYVPFILLLVVLWYLVCHKL